MLSITRKPAPIPLEFTMNESTLSRLLVAEMWEDAPVPRLVGALRDRGTDRVPLVLLTNEGGGYPSNDHGSYVMATAPYHLGVRLDAAQLEVCIFQ